MLPDMINAGFEFGAGLAVLHHCLMLHRHKQVRGVSPPAILFFVAWGVWNLFYYPHLGQIWSFVGGVFVTLANALYVGMLWVYGGHEEEKAEVDQLFREANLNDPGYQLWEKHKKAAEARSRLRDMGKLP